MADQHPIEEFSTRGNRPGSVSLVAGLMFCAAAFIVAYWITWFSGGRALLATSQASSYFAFENAFPAGDVWLTVTLLLGAVGLLRQRSWGLLCSLLAGGAGIYLGCVEVLFNLENNVYNFQQGANVRAVITAIAINVLIFALSLTILRYAWRHRKWLLGSELLV